MLHPSRLHYRLATAASRYCHGRLDLSHPVCCSLRDHPHRGKDDGQRSEVTIRSKATTSERLRSLVVACAQDICRLHPIQLLLLLPYSISAQELEKLFPFFKTSTRAKEKLREVQAQLKKPPHELIQEVETRWNSAFFLLRRLHGQREPVGAAPASLPTDVVPLSCVRPWLSAFRFWHRSQ